MQQKKRPQFDNRQPAFSPWRLVIWSGIIGVFAYLWYGSPELRRMKSPTLLSNRK